MPYETITNWEELEAVVEVCAEAAIETAKDAIIEEAEMYAQMNAEIREYECGLGR